jgi:hypothetical protein
MRPNKGSSTPHTFGAIMNAHAQVNSRAEEFPTSQRDVLNFDRQGKAVVNNAALFADDKKASPFSPLLCVLLPLAAGIFAKVGVALQLFHLAH